MVSPDQIKMPLRGIKKKARKPMGVVARQKQGTADAIPEGGIAVATPVPLEETLCGGMASPIRLLPLQESSGAGAVFITADKASFHCSLRLSGSRCCKVRIPHCPSEGIGSLVWICSVGGRVFVWMHFGNAEPCQAVHDSNDLPMIAQKETQRTPYSRSLNTKDSRCSFTSTQWFRKLQTAAL